MTLRRLLCALLGGHHLGRVLVWRDGKARLRCGYGCGYETSGVETSPPAQSPMRIRVCRQRRNRFRVVGR